MFKQSMATLIGVVTLGVALTEAAKAANVSQIFSFGDSLVDAGNAFSGYGVPPSPPYFAGRFSNGPIWTDYLAADLGIPQTSLGFGGAASSDRGLLLFGGGVVGPVPGLLAQVEQFVASSVVVDPDALYVLWAGANDYLFAGTTDPNQPVSNLVAAVSTLNAVGAENFLLVNLPDLGALPLIRLRGLPEEPLNTLSALHNQALANQVETLGQTSNLKIDLLDANRLFKSALASDFGFINPTDACTLTPGCLGVHPVQDEFLFWDEVHPTTAAHRILADEALNQLAAVPEPLTLFGLATFGAVAVGGALKKGAA